MMYISKHMAVRWALPFLWFWQNYRATNMCSVDNVQDEETKIKEILKENGYPRKFLIKQQQSQ